ncbi:flagellar hook-basal body complex protein FliE [Paenibacillus sp. CF384]|uniref:flagellar hook-basal body complex protein FliE n=1 Tax=Paenibacillus sp. CF384 TaxID=1884382 RepID=UPI000896C40F|nr:flagellar hook-basal body complex protein FliE [Paenibacillus sp. CF384]SDW27776.1 flagellar hook-basal body complex protein FliE [Paenibacillus sp. CF384]
MINPLSLNMLQSQNVKLFDSGIEKTDVNAEGAASASDMTKSFSDFLKNALDGVSAQEKNVHTMNDQYLIGNVDISQVMVASQQAELGLQLTSQVRNKVIEAYQEIMRMQI